MKLCGRMASICSISSLYNFFFESPKNFSRLDKSSDIVKKSECEKHATRNKHLFLSRLLSFDESVSAICENYSPLSSILSEDSRYIEKCFKLEFFEIVHLLCLIF